MAAYAVGRDNPAMGSALTEARVRGDLDVLSRGGLNLDDFFAEATEAVRRAVPWAAACVGTHDPATMILTSGRKYGALAEMNSHDDVFAELEYADEEPTSFRALAHGPTRAIGLHSATDGDVRRSVRMDRLHRPVFGFADEMRVLFRDAAGVWGGMALMRGPDDPAFSPVEVAFMASLSESFARGVRTGIMSRLADSPALDMVRDGPAVVIVDSEDEVVRISAGAEQRIADLNTALNGTDPFSILLGLVQAARSVSASRGAGLPRARVRTASGLWLVLHAAPMVGRDGLAGDVVVTIEEARPSEILELVVAAFGLTPREREVTHMVLRGTETKTIASTLHLSAYTVQDHLKSVFDKAGVRSRRELISRVYFDHYLPRYGAEVGPSGGLLPPASGG